MPWHVVPDHSECSSDESFAVVKDSDGSVVGCHATRQEADDQVAALYASEEDASTMEHFHAIMVIEGESTGLRTFTNLSWREPPFAFHWEIDSAAHGGAMRVVQVGTVTRVEKVGSEIHGWGPLDLEDANAQEYARKLVGGHTRWVSIGLDEQPVETTVEWNSDDGPEELFERPKQVHYDGGRIGELTAVSVPALDSAIIEPTQALLDVMEFDNGESATTAPAAAASNAPVDGGTEDGQEIPAVIQAAVHAIQIPDLPPSSWFDEPTDVQMAGALTVTDEGRLYGYLAPLGTAHRSFDRRVTVPVGRVDYSRWMGKETICEGGERVVTGCLTMECGHALTRGPRSAAAPAQEHYDNSCSIVATARIGENRHGVWIAGALMPDITAGQVARMLACTLSGDWRPHKDRPGWRELIGALLVPVPAFAMARSNPSVTFRDDVLVASTVPVRYSGQSVLDEATEVLETARQALAVSLGLDPESRKNELMAEILGE